MWTYIILGGISIIAFLCWFFPVYGVWVSKKSGEAELEEANYKEQIAVAEARARKGAANLNKEAEIIDAEAVSISINTIGKSLQKNDSYLRWQWIKMMDKTENSTIYVPTEANLPILEAVRMQKPPITKEEE